MRRGGAQWRCVGGRYREGKNIFGVHGGGGRGTMAGQRQRVFCVGGRLMGPTLVAPVVAAMAATDGARAHVVCGLRGGGTSVRPHCSHVGGGCRGGGTSGRPSRDEAYLVREAEADVWCLGDRGIHPQKWRRGRQGGRRHDEDGRRRGRAGQQREEVNRRWDDVGEELREVLQGSNMAVSEGRQGRSGRGVVQRVDDVLNASEDEVGGGGKR